MKFIYKQIIAFVILIFLLFGSLFVIFDKQTILQFPANNTSSFIIFCAICLSLLLLSIFLFQRRITRPLNQLTTFIQRLTDENLPENFKLDNLRKDEIGKLNKQATQLAVHMRLFDQYLKRVEKGTSWTDEANHVPGSEKLHFILFQIKEKEALISRLRKENSTALWHQEGATRLYTLLQKSTGDFDQFLNDLVLFLSEYTSVPQIGIFITEESGNKKILRLRACRAYDKKKEIESIYEIGEGLPGRAAYEQKDIHIKDLPEGYSYLTSGLGEESITQILLVPIVYNKHSLGVFEFMSPKEIEPHTVSFLKAVADRISSEIFIRKLQKI
ncbi:MAG: hypothetical protein CSB06_02730 [Bacteroidia bacterium]|nr:MAG: hypothetical protein CSB06_02730 [Bacteroidia bacterium]